MVKLTYIGTTGIVDLLESTINPSNIVPLIIYRISYQNPLEWTTEPQNDKL